MILSWIRQKRINKKLALLDALYLRITNGRSFLTMDDFKPDDFWFLVRCGRMSIADGKTHYRGLEIK